MHVVAVGGKGVAGGSEAGWRRLVAAAASAGSGVRGRAHPHPAPAHLPPQHATPHLLPTPPLASALALASCPCLAGVVDAYWEYRLKVGVGGAVGRWELAATAAAAAAAAQAGCNGCLLRVKQYVLAEGEAVCCRCRPVIVS